MSGMLAGVPISAALMCLPEDPPQKPPASIRYCNLHGFNTRDHLVSTPDVLHHPQVYTHTHRTRAHIHTRAACHRHRAAHALPMRSMVLAKDGLLCTGTLQRRTVARVHCCPQALGHQDNIFASSCIHTGNQTHEGRCCLAWQPCISNLSSAHPGCVLSTSLMADKASSCARSGTPSASHAADLKGITTHMMRMHDCMLRPAMHCSATNTCCCSRSPSFQGRHALPMHVSTQVTEELLPPSICLLDRKPVPSADNSNHYWDVFTTTQRKYFMHEHPWHRISDHRTIHSDSRTPTHLAEVVIAGSPFQRSRQLPGSLVDLAGVPSRILELHRGCFDGFKA